MSDTPETQKPGGEDSQEGAPEGDQPTEEELREKLEQEIRKVRVEDVLLQSVVSVLNLTARRIAKDDERDLEQARIGIDACRALLDHLPEEAAGQVREALSELQMLYAKHAKEGGAEGGGEGGAEPEGGKQEGSGGESKGESGLWTPGGSS